MRNELYHHGILGQKWGVRRFQNKDGSLTTAGRKRYNVGVETAKERVKAAKKETIRANIPLYLSPLASKTAYERAEKAREKLDWEKSKLSSEKIKARWTADPHKKTKRQLKLEQQYLEKGMSQEEAEIAAYKRDRTEKILAIAAGVTVASAAAYVAYKQYDKTVDRLIPQGTLLQNISDNNGNSGIRDAFYFSMTKGDNTEYRGMLGKDIKDRSGDVFETKIGVKSGLKIASEKNARKALQEMISSDPTNADMLKKRLRDWESSPFVFGKQYSVFTKALKSLKKGKIDSNVYDAFNVSLVGAHNEKLNKDFYNLLTSKGYNAIMDINDKRYSGYKTAKPMIAFNTGAKTAVESIRQIGDKELNNAYVKANIAVGAKTLTPILAAMAGVSATANGLQKMTRTRKNDKLVSEYKRKHPNTKLSYNEIVDRYYNK